MSSRCKANGLAVVQHSMMPQNALSHAGADYRCRVEEMPGLLVRLAAEIATGAGRKEMEIVDEPRRREGELLARPA